MNQNYLLGMALAAVSSVFFGLYIIPRKFSKISPILFTLFLGVGYFIGSLLLYGILFLYTGRAENLIYSFVLFSVFQGVFWTLGSIWFLISIDSIGLSRATQWKNLQGPIGIILGLFVLSEFASTNLIFALLSGLAIFISAILFTIPGNKEEVKNQGRGILFAVLTAISGGAVVLNKFISINYGIYAQQVILSFSTFIFMLLYVSLNGKYRNELKKTSLKELFLGVASGLLILGATFFLNQSYFFIPSSLAFTIVQMNAILVIAVGIFLFKEIDYAKNKSRLVLGLAFVILSIMLIFFAKR